MAEPEVVSRIEPPRGIHQSSVDAKGRMKLSSTFHRFLKDSKETKVFITTWDKKSVRVYPISVWNDTEALFESDTENPEESARTHFFLNKWGEDSDVDGEGRVLVPQKLRKIIELEGQPVWLLYTRGAIDVYNRAVYELKDTETESISPSEIARQWRRGVK